MKRSVNIGAALIIYPRVFLAGMYTFWFESAINMYIQINGIRVSYFSLYEIDLILRELLFINTIQTKMIVKFQTTVVKIIKMED